MRQSLLSILLLFSSFDASAALCSRIQTFVDGNVLSASELNSEFNNNIDCVNSISDANVSTAAAISPSKLSASIAGDGIGRNGSTGVLSVNVDNSSIEIVGDTLQAKDSGVTTAKINDGAVTTPKLANDAVTSGKILDGTVSLADMASGSVDFSKLVAEVQNALVPTGSILPFGGTSAPTGYLMCDGSSVSRTTFAALFTAISVNFGQGDGVNTFNVPDFRGRFLRGTDNGAGNDPDAGSRSQMASGGNTGDNVGSIQLDELKSHTHTYNVDPASGATSGLAFSSNGSTRSTQATGGNETRPKNANVNYIIRY